MVVEASFYARALEENTLYRVVGAIRQTSHRSFSYDECIDNDEIEQQSKADLSLDSKLRANEENREEPGPGENMSTSKQHADAVKEKRKTKALMNGYHI